MLCACPASIPLFRDHLHPHPPRWGFLAQPLCVSFVLSLHHPSPDFTDVLLLFFVFGLFFPKPSFLCPSTRAEAFPASWAPLSAPRGAGPASARTAVREPLYDIWTFILRQAGLLCGCQLSPRSELVATLSVEAAAATAERWGRSGKVRKAGSGSGGGREGAHTFAGRCWAQLFPAGIRCLTPQPSRLGSVFLSAPDPSLFVLPIVLP